MIAMFAEDEYSFIKTLIMFAVGASVTLIKQYFNNKEQTEANERLLKAESKITEFPGQVKPAWDLARITLEAYFNRNLSHISSIFWFSVGAMVCGLAIIVWGISQSATYPDTVAPTAIAGVAGIITEFIGATFLFIYKSTIQQAIGYTKTLERINSVGMAMQILDTIPDSAKGDDINLKSQTKARLVEILMNHAHKTQQPLEDNTDKNEATKNEETKTGETKTIIS